MALQTPELEDWFNRYEAGARFSLGGTMVTPWDGAGLQAFLPDDWSLNQLQFGYVPTPGSEALRALIAAEDELTPEQLILTTGATEANHTVLSALVRPGDNIILQDPLYYQFEGVARDRNAAVRRWSLPADPYLPPDLDAFAALLDERTRLVVLNTPHNPTGRVLSPDVLRELFCLVEERSAAHVLVDEIYRGVGAPLAFSALALSERAIVTNAVSKRWSLPGLRLGWIASRSAVLSLLRPYHEHATCCVSALSEQLLLALWPRRSELFAANSAISDRNRRLFADWLARSEHVVHGVLPPGGVMALLFPRLERDDRIIARALRERASLFCLPGSALGVPGALRVGFGQRDEAALHGAFASLEQGLASLRGKA